MKSQRAEESRKGGRASVAQTHRPDDKEQESIEGLETIDQVPTPDGSEKGARAEEDEDTDTRRSAGTAGLAVLLSQIVAYFSGRADVDDMDVLSFSLHHLFCRVDFLYRKALPILSDWTSLRNAGQMQSNDVLYRRQMWMQLQIINRALDRMEPLCHLLSDAAECILDSFDITSEMILPAGSEHERTGMPFESMVSGHGAIRHADDHLWLHMIDQERWELALTSVTESLMSWQEYYHKLAPFAVQFANLLPLAPLLPQLDGAFAALLDSAGAIFGDILPAFRAIAVGDDAAVAAVLFDLMQQSDRLLVQFDTTLEPMNALIKHFAVL